MFVLYHCFVLFQTRHLALCVRFFGVLAAILPRHVGCSVDIQGRLLVSIVYIESRAFLYVVCMCFQHVLVEFEMNGLDL